MSGELDCGAIWTVRMLYRGVEISLCPVPVFDHQLRTDLISKIRALHYLTGLRSTKRVRPTRGLELWPVEV